MASSWTLQANPWWQWRTIEWCVVERPRSFLGWLNSGPMRIRVPHPPWFYSPKWKVGIISVVVWLLNDPTPTCRLLCLNIWTLAGGTALGEDGALRRWSLAGRSHQEVRLGVHSPIPFLMQFWFLLPDCLSITNGCLLLNGLTHGCVLPATIP